MSVVYWVIEASRDGVVYDDQTFVQGTREQAKDVAESLQRTLAFHDFSRFIVRPEPLTAAEMVEHVLS